MTDPSLHDLTPVSKDSLDAAKREHGLRMLTHILYALYALSWFTGGVSALIAVIINYVKRDEAAGTLYASHFTWQIRTFWWSLPFGLLGYLLFIFVVGYFIMIAVAIWVLYRVIKGWLYLNDGKPMGPRLMRTL